MTQIHNVKQFVPVVAKDLTEATCSFVTYLQYGLLLCMVVLFRLWARKHGQHSAMDPSDGTSVTLCLVMTLLAPVRFGPWHIHVGHLRL